MGYPDINNETGIQFEPLVLADEDAAAVFVPFLAAAYGIPQSGPLEPMADKTLDLGGEFWGDPSHSSVKFESQIAFTKLATDVVLIGCARSPQPTATLDVGLKVGNLRKTIRVFGDRYWAKQGGNIFATKPQPFVKMPLIYERAFGGWDKADVSEDNWRYEPCNPVGVGFGDPLRFVDEGKVPIPNIEDPNNLIRRYGDSPPPAGFGFVSPNWQPRVHLAGTYDEKWDKTRKPLLPDDFDRRFFNAASPGLVAPDYLRGDEDVMIVNASPVPKLKFSLPGVPPPVCHVGLRNGRTEVLRTNLDTVIIDTDAMMVFLIWRNYLQVPNGPHDVVSIEIATEQDLHAAATV